MLRALFDLIRTVPLDDEDVAVEEMATRLVKEGMGTAAILFLESSKPLGFVAGQVALAASPFIGGFVEPARIERYSDLFSDRAFIERIIQRVEELENERAGNAKIVAKGKERRAKKNNDKVPNNPV